MWISNLSNKMWPQFLDMTRDECRGVLRRLELESYSNVVGTLRAQGRLSDDKKKLLKDLREKLHISEDRHKAEIRKAANDEVYSTIAKTIFGPNTEIEWHKEGARGFSILPRNPPQTALSYIADRASEHAEALNSNLPSPTGTQRERKLKPAENDGENKQLVTSDPLQIKIDAKRKEDATTVSLEHEQLKKRRSSGKISIQNMQNNNKNSPKIVNQTMNAGKRLKQKKGEEPTAPKPILVARRRESIKPKVISTNDNHQVTSNSVDSTQATENLNTRTDSDTTYKSQDNTALSGIAATEKATEINAKQITINSMSHETVDSDKAYLVATHSKKIVSPQKLPASQNVALEPAVNQISKPLKFLDANSAIIRPNQQNNIIPGVVMKNPVLQTKVSGTQPVAMARVPPKIQILSQHTLTKNNSNYIPMTDNNIVITSDSKLANAIKSQKIQILPSQHNIVKSNMIIRGTNSNPTYLTTSSIAPATTRGMRFTTLPANKIIQTADKGYASNVYQKRNNSAPDRNVYVLKVQPPTNIHPIETAYSANDSETEIIAEEFEGVEYIVDESQNYEVTDNNRAYTAIVNDDLPRPAKIARLSNSHNLVRNHQGHNVYNNYQTVNKKYVMSSVPKKAKRVKSQPIPIQRIIYEDVPTDWEYELDQRKKSIISSSSDSLSQINNIIRNEEYVNSPDVVYEEVYSSDNITEEYVTTEDFSSNDDLIEMDGDLVDNDGNHYVCTEETATF